MALRTLNYHTPANPLSPLNRGLVGWWRVLPGRMGGAQLWDLTNQHPAVLANLSPSTGTVGWAPTTRLGGHGEIRLPGGTTGKLTAGVAPVFEALALGPLTYAAWVYPPTLVEGANFFSRDGGTDAAYLGCTSRSDGGVNFYRHYSGTPSEVNLQTGYDMLLPNLWRHLLVTWDGSPLQTGIRVYVDGFEWWYLSGTDAGGTPTTDASFAMTFGGGDAPTSQTWNGAIDDIRLYNRVLSHEEATMLFQTSRLGSPQELAWMTLPVEIPTWAPPPPRPRLRAWKRRV